MFDQTGALVLRFSFAAAAVLAPAFLRRASIWGWDAAVGSAYGGDRPRPVAVDGPTPEWAPGAERDSPDGWDQYVGSVLYEDRDAAVFIDPLLPGDQDQFWRWADERVAGRSAVVLTTLGPHRRNREQVAQRYAASTSRAKRNLPSGVESIVLRGAGETMFWLPKHRTLVPGDRILGAPDGGLRLCPESWLYWVPRRPGQPPIA